jgi:transposase
MLSIPTLLFPSCPDLLLEEITCEGQTLFLTVRSSKQAVACSVCEHVAVKVHSRYTRTLADLSLMDYAVRLRVQARRFFCSNPACVRKTFAEPFTDLAVAHARRTNRQAVRLSAIAKELGGRPAVRESENVQMPVSRHTLLRLLRRTPVPDAPAPRVLGVDDWSIRRGRTYATLLVDLERHRIVDVLPDREAQTLQAWLAAHPSVEVISRDRAGAYAQGARKGAPQAQQVTDRFHLLLNLQDALKRLFERKQEQLKHLVIWEPAQEEQAKQSHEALPTPLSEPLQLIIVGPQLSPAHEAQRRLRRERRKQRYDEVIKLHEQGVSQVAIATLLGLDRDTVRRYIKAPSFPESVRPKRTSLLDPYKKCLRERWATGQCTARSLFAELRARGYQGGATLVSDYLRPLREHPDWWEAYQQQKARQAQGKRVVPLSARQAAWLFICPPRKLTLRQVRELEPLRLEDEELGSVYQLVQDFRTMVTQRQVSVLPRWLNEAQACGIPELKSFVSGIYRDYDAVRAALATEHSNGQTEGKVNKLKCIKRQMYGRANFDLLRQRLLLCA